MCFAKRLPYRSDLKPMYEDDGTVNDEIIPNVVQIPEGIVEHIDNPFLNIDLEEGILAFIYESRYNILIVWTSDEACSYIQELTTTS